MDNEHGFGFKAMSERFMRVFAKCGSDRQHLNLVINCNIDRKETPDIMCSVIRQTLYHL